MYAGCTIFSQLMDIIPKYEFCKIVTHYKGDYRIQNLSCHDQFLCMCFGQLTFRNSLRDLTTTLEVLGFRSPLANLSGSGHDSDRSCAATLWQSRSDRIDKDLGLLDHRLVFVAVSMGRIPFP